MSAEFPFIGSTSALNANTLPLFKMYAWDFEKDDFIFDGNGKRILLEGNPALEVWIYKALMTDRFIYKAYTWRYGSEVKKFIGKVMHVKERISELKRMVIECLMVNPYIRSVDLVEFVEDEHGRQMQMNITLTSIYGKLTV